MFRRWMNPCAKCNVEFDTVNMRSITIGTSTWLLCKICSKKYDQVKAVLAVKFQAFLRQE